VAELLERCLQELPDADTRALLRASAASYRLAQRAHFGPEHDPSAIRGERNAFRYRACRSLIARGSLGAQLCQVLLAASVLGVPLMLSLPPDPPPWPWLEGLSGVQLAVETEPELAQRLKDPAGAERLRVWETLPAPVRAAANAAGVTVIDAPVLATGRLELRWYLREQVVSRVLHRYGNVAEPAAAE
jgi:RHH-type proline utilization regulon transcriptional repressor/proline dehydrogenase/delta 1-pyrroline-5-carboxylate dehydrogenase